jgi:hypothetical protein
MCNTGGLYTNTWEVRGSSLIQNAGYSDGAFYGFPWFPQTDSVVSALVRVSLLLNPFQFIISPTVDALYFSILTASENEP